MNASTFECPFRTFFLGGVVPGWVWLGLAPDRTYPNLIFRMPMNGQLGFTLREIAAATSTLVCEFAVVSFTIVFAIG